MENARFDALAKALGAPVNRRWLAAAAILGLMPAQAFAEGPDAEMIPPPCRRIRQQCATGAECCSGRCILKADGTSRCGRKHGGKRGGGGGGRDGGGGGGGGTCGTEGTLCTTSAECCEDFDCQITGPNEFRCLPAPPPQTVVLGNPCNPQDTCEEGTCQTYTDSMKASMNPMNPEQTYCLLNLGAACDASDPDHVNWSSSNWLGCKGTQCWGSICGNRVNVNTPSEQCGDTMDSCKNSGHNVWMPGAGGGVCSTDVEGNGYQFSSWSNVTCNSSQDCSMNQRCAEIQTWSVCNGSGMYTSPGSYCLGYVAD
jgi:hypothetical protein